MSAADLTSRLELAISAAKEAGDLTLTYFRGADIGLEIKEDKTPVTIADKKAEELIRDRILAKFPSDSVLGEEMPEQRGSSGYRWILDPIDGTKSFVAGVPLYGTMIGIEIEAEKRGVVGVVRMPGLDEVVFAAEGQGCWHQVGKTEAVRAKVSSVDKLSDCIFCYNDVNTYDTYKRADAFHALRKQVRLPRGWGDCYGYSLVATGRTEIMIDPKMSVWDAAALEAIMYEAGGTFTNWKGERTIWGNEGVATNGKLFEQVMQYTRGA